MMRRPGWLAILALPLLSRPVSAQFGGMGGPQGAGIARAVEVELDNGQKIRGKLDLGSVTIDTDVGQYQISARRIRTIRLSTEVKPSEGPHPWPPRVRGTVVTTSGREINGTVLLSNWTLAIDDGTLTLSLPRLRKISFAAEAGEKTPTRPGPGAPDAKAKPLQSSDSGRAPVEVNAIEGQGIVALIVSGPKVTRIAASDALYGAWQTQDLRDPAEGTVSPIIGPGVAVYSVGRYIYAYIAEAHRWGVLELPEGSKAMPIVGPGLVTVRNGHHIYTFGVRTGEWKHIDLSHVLDAGGAQEAVKTELPN